MPSEKKSSFSAIFWRIVISAVGAALIVVASAWLLLFFFGKTAAADVTVRRVGGADSGKTPGQRYEWSLGYTFVDGDGVTRSGNATRRGSDISVETDATVYYFSFAPYINALKGEAEPGFIQPLYIAVGIFLIYIMNRKRKIPPETDFPEANG